MGSIPRRTIDELVIRYKLEPELRDVYVEGDFDRSLIEWFIDGINSAGVKVYKIETVEVPSEIVDAVTRREGNKGRVIALAKEIESRTGIDLNILCIVDSDLDEHLTEIVEGRYICRTDYSCMESYLYDQEIVERLFILYFGIAEDKAADFLCDSGAILLDLYLVRLVKYLLAPGISWMDPRKCMMESNGQLVLDLEEFVRRLLNKSEWKEGEERFFEEIENCRQRLRGDTKHSLHGHDMVVVVITWVRQIAGVTSRLEERDVHSAWSAAIERENIKDEVLFDKIKSLCSAD